MAVMLACLLFKKWLILLEGVCMLISVFGAVALMVVMYNMIIVFSLNLKGVAGIVTGLIPSIALSAAPWYIKKRLEKEVGQSNTATSQLPQVSCHSMGQLVEL